MLSASSSWCAGAVTDGIGSVLPKGEENGMKKFTQCSSRPQLRRNNDHFIGASEIEVEKKEKKKKHITVPVR